MKLCAAFRMNASFVYHILMYVCMHVCMYVRSKPCNGSIVCVPHPDVCMYACMYVCTE